MTFESTFLGVDVRTWITGGAMVLLVAVAHLALRFWTRRRERTHKDRPLAPGESASARQWIARGLSDAVPPIAFLLWLHGVHLAVSLLVADFPPSSWMARALFVLEWVRGVGTLLGLAWLLARVARTIEAVLKSAEASVGVDPARSEFVELARNASLNLQN